MSDKLPNLRHLDAFVKIYELGTLVAAAKSVNITQPAITQGLARLEQTIDCKLFERQSDGMQPTDGARLLYPRAVSALRYVGSNRVTHTQMRAFVAIAKWGGYAPASTATGLARASLKRAVTDLQIAIDKGLVTRVGRGVQLTTIGKRVARRFRLAINEIENGVEELEGLKGVDGGHIAIGAMPLSRARVLPSAIVEFKQTRPAAHISVAEGSYFELVEPLRNGELDFVIGALRDPPPGADLVQSELFEDLPVVVARRDHPLPERKGLVDIRKIAEYDWCIPKIGAPLRANWERMFSGPGLSIPNISVECGSVMTIRQILMGTNCLSLLSPDQFAVELDAGLLKIVGQAPDSTRRKIGVTHREGWRPTPLQDSFIATLKSVSSCSNRS